MTPTDVTPRKANLFIVGAPKCGTTAWVEYLRHHPQIFFPDSKEDCFFAHDLPRFRFIHSEEEYSKLFSESGDAKIVGEASAMYLFSTTAAEAIHAYNASAKVLIFLREQEEYLPSLHNQFLWEFNEEIGDFDTVWNFSGNRPPQTIPARCLEPRTLDYKAMGRFHEQVARYLAFFPQEQVRVIRFREWTVDPRKTYLEILELLGIADDGRSKFPRINPGVTYRWRRLVRFLYYPPPFARRIARILKRATGLQSRTVGLATEKAIGLLSAPGYKKEISPKMRLQIRRYYAQDNQLLEQLLNRGAQPAKDYRGRTRARSASA